MSRILLENHGRMANQLVAWAKAMCWKKKPETQFVIRYAPLIGQVELPETDIVSELEGLPRADVGHEPDHDCYWPAQPLWDSQPPNDEFEKWIESIRFSDSVTKEVDTLMGNFRYIGMHVRYGDYVEVDTDHPQFPLPPFVRASKEYFLGNLYLLDGISECFIFVASDGKPEELTWLPPCVRNRADANPALDLYALSKCEVIIGSASTFGHLAAIHGGKRFIWPTS